MSKILGIIPARYASQRLEGKALVDIGGKTMIQRVYEQCRKSQKLDQVMVATDDKRIYKEALSFGAEVMMTSIEHPSGTDRCAEVAEKMAPEYPIILNIQGDQPFINPQQIDELAALFEAEDTQIGTLAKKITNTNDLIDDTLAKIALDQNNQALYMSRSPIPHLRGFPIEEWLDHKVYYKHVGIYGFKTEVLLKVAQLSPSPIEQMEKLEQLRWLSYFKIKVGITTLDTLSIDTSQDLEKARVYLEEQSF